MKPITLAAMFGALVFVAPSCGGTSEAATAAGTYQMDVDATVNGMVDSMNKAMGKTPSAEERNAAMATMKKMFVSGTMQLKDDMTFTASSEMGSPIGNQPPAKHTSRGKWEVKQGALTFNVTHQDGKEKPQTATGKLENGVLSLTMKENGKEATMIFKKE